jgi:acyl transferase domain-containing protein/acyl carrier protein/NAD(P)-dependent dehydrogenase (short-subunit alcohol dehydrogenase family)/phosphopantetheinyl transferase
MSPNTNHNTPRIGVVVVLPPTAAHTVAQVLAAGCTPVIDATGEAVPNVPQGAWVRTRPGRPAPGTGPVILAELGAPVPDRDTWLETSVPREVPAGFAGLVLKGREAGGLCGEEDGLVALARCSDPSRVILDAGVGPHTAAAAAALGAAGVLLVEPHLGCPEMALPPGLSRRLLLADDEATRVVGGLRVCASATAPVLRRQARGDDPWALQGSIWRQGDPSEELWLVGQGIALARTLAERHGTLEALLSEYRRRFEDPASGQRRATTVPMGRPAGTAASLAQPGAVATTGGSVGSAVLWEEAVWLSRPVHGGPLPAAAALGGPVVAEPQELEALQETLPQEIAAEPVVAEPVVAEPIVVAPVPEPVPAVPPAAPAPLPAPAAPVAEPVPVLERATPAVAIVGIGCRFPGGSSSPQQFWDNIVAGRYAIGTVPPERWDPALFYDPDESVPDKTYSQIGGFLTDFVFEPKAFRIPPNVARQVDPVQQITLMCVRDALLDAGLQVDKRSPGREFDRERCAVILGNSLGGEMSDRYAIRLAWPDVAQKLVSMPPFCDLSEAERLDFLKKMEAAYKAGLPIVDEDSMPGELANVIAGRIANAFDLGGANYTVDAACASSMAAIQAAVKSLQDGDSDIVLTGGADRSMNIATYVKFCKIGALSPDHSAPFDASANGFVMGEGCGILVLKRYEDALRDGDRVYALIRGIGASSDGKGKGITAPNVAGQVRALQRAYAAAGVDPALVDLVEAHGTSTVVGDKVEVEALNLIIGEGRRQGRGPIRLGSVKSMIGHLKSAAGAAAVIKAALALYHGVLPPSANYKTPRPDMPLDRIPLQVQTAAEPWPETPDGIRRAGVSAFGFGGTNFHVVLESDAGRRLPSHARRLPPEAQKSPAKEAPAKEPPAREVPARARVISLSAPPPKPEPMLPEGIWATSGTNEAELLANLKLLADKRPAPFQASARLRIAAAATDAAEREEQLQRAIKAIEKGSNPDLLRARNIAYEDVPFDRKLVFVFTGQGSQYLDMGLDLAARWPVVADTFAEADRVLTGPLGRPITSFIRLQEGEDAAAKEDLLRQTEYSQPATLTIDVALLRLLVAYGVMPDMVAGHSLGEYGAAVAAGVMSFEQSLLAVSARGREMASIRIDDPGKMAGIAAATNVVDEVLADVGGYVIAANKNCPTQTVIAGASDAVDEACERFKAKGITVYLLPVSHAFHSSIVQPASEPLKGVLHKIGLSAPRRPITTNVTGDWYPPDTNAIIELLAQQISAPVEWISQMERMYEDGGRIFVEVGPKRALSGFTVSILKRRPHRAVYTNHPKRGGVPSFLDALAQLLALGLPVRATPLATSELDLFATPEPRRATTQAQTAYLELHPVLNAEGGTAPSGSTEAAPDLREGVLRIVAKTSGYEIEELDLDYELEADLGIDTVKQAEVFSVVRETYGIPADPSFSFGDHRTLRALIDWAATRTGSRRLAVEEEAPAPVPAPAPAAQALVAAPPVPSGPPLADPAVVATFLEKAAKSGLAGLDAESFAMALLPAVQGLLQAAYQAAAANTRPAEPAPAPAPALAPAPAPAPTPIAVRLAGAPYATDASRKIVCSGTAIGLPGGDEVFGADNFAQILTGRNRISHLQDRAQRFLDLGLVRLVKDPQTGQGSFLPVQQVSEVIRLAGIEARFDLREYDVDQDLVGALDVTTRLAFAAGLEALRDAGIPLVRTWKTTTSGKRVPQGWALPEALRDGTGVIFGSAFPGYDQFARHLAQGGRDDQGRFDRRFLFQVLAMGHSQFAQLIGARGPNTSVNAACASSTQALALAEDWIRAGRCERVIVVGADDVTSEALLPWIGGGFMAAGAATTHDVLEEAALPFDRRRHGLILGMGAVGVVVETERSCRERGVVPLAEQLAAVIVNSAFHGTRLDVEHIAGVMQRVVADVCAAEGITPSEMARHAFFMSHETYTPARGGSAAAEIEALRRAFGEDARHVVVTNTKGFTGHPMGAGIEDGVVLKSLQYGAVPPIANLAEPDESLGDLRLSRGERRPFRYAVRLAAGFGSQLALTVHRAVARGDDRLADREQRVAWLQKITGYPHVAEQIQHHMLRAVASETDQPYDMRPDVSPETVLAQHAPAAAAPPAPAPRAQAPAPAPVQERAPGKPSDTIVPLPERSAGQSPSFDAVLKNLVEVVAAKTGYDTAEIEPDFELEADLGIDTVKQAEILGELTERYGLQRDDSFRIADYPTLTALAGYLMGRAAGAGGDVVPSTQAPFPEREVAPKALRAVSPSSPPPIPVLAPQSVQAQIQAQASQPPRAPAPAPGDALQDLIEVVASKTGYEPSEIEPNFELEADLGIDTVKQAEIMGELTERYGLVRDESFRLAEHPTVEKLAAYLASRRQGGAPAPVPAPEPVPEPEPVPAMVMMEHTPALQPVGPSQTLRDLIEVVASKTGYEPSEIEPNFELEADLGIDTVKQAEIMGELTERYGLQRDDSFRLADHPTVEKLATYLASRTPSDPADVQFEDRNTDSAVPEPPPAPALPERLVVPPAARPPQESAAYQDTLGELIGVVASKTGYEAHDLEPSFELEADLGIDTVKQAEIMGELTDRMGVARDESFRLADHPTLEALARWLHDRRQTLPDDPDSEATSEEVPAQRDFVAEEFDLSVGLSLAETVAANHIDLPPTFRVRRPVLEPRPAPRPTDLDGRHVQVLGDTPVAHALLAELTLRGARFQAPFDVVIDAADDVMYSFGSAKLLDGARPKHWLAVTRLGGLEGIEVPVERAFIDGARAGFTKSLGREWEATTRARVVDVHPFLDPTSTARALCDEIGIGQEREVFIDVRGKRTTVRLVDEVPPEPKPLGDRPVVVLTGGGRGITARVALELARRGEISVVLVGRSEISTVPLDERSAKEQIRAQLQLAGERVTPARVEAALSALRKSDEIRRTLEELRAMGAEASYVRADLANPDEVASLVEGVLERHGTIDVFVHGAGVEESRQLQDKDEAAFHRVFDGKALGGQTLMAHVPPSTYVVSMGSVAGRFGNAGQVDYGAANDALARLCHTRPHSLHVDWTAWDDVGMAVRGGMRGLLTERGVELLPADAGAALLASLVANRVTGELVVAGALGDFEEGPEHPLLDTLELGVLGASGDGELTARGTRSFTRTSDPWLLDHAIDGVPVLPGVIGLELMAAVAAPLFPGLPWRGARAVRFEAPVKVHRDGVTTVVIDAVATSTREAKVVLSSQRRLATGRVQRLDHFSAIVVFGEGLPLDGLPSVFLPDEEVDQSAIYKRFFHGPSFQVLQAVFGVSQDGLVGEGAVRHAAVGEGLVTAPLVLEAAFQAAGLHQMMVAHTLALPFELDEVQLLGQVTDGQPLSITAQLDGDRYHVDVDAVSGPVLRLRGFAMVEKGPVPPPERFPEPEGGRQVCFPTPSSPRAPTTPWGAGVRGEALSNSMAEAIAEADASEDTTPWLSTDELRELEERGTERRIRDRIAGRIAAKRALSGLLGVDPLDIQLSTAASGEPIVSVPGFPHARVSISHREGRAVAVAVAQGRVGVDLEKVEPRSESFGKTWFRDDEQHLQSDPSTQTLAWAIKEAVLKWLGTGLRLSPHDVRVLDVREGTADIELMGDARRHHAELGGDALSVGWSMTPRDEVLVTVRTAA